MTTTCIPSRRPPLQALRRGISIIEVMIAIGVATVGLLGVILLLPVALHQIRQGTLHDRAGRLGENAVHELHVRGLLQPDMLVGWDKASNTWRSYAPSPYEGFCLDPQFCAYRSFTIAPLPPPTDADRDQGTDFPYAYRDTGNNLYSCPFPMRRVTLLRQQPTSTITPLTPFSAPLNVIMNALQAERIFVGSDDLRFQAPTSDRTYAAVQRDESGAAWDPTQPGSRRNAEERLSWIATFSPKEGVPSSNLIANGTFPPTVTFPPNDPSDPTNPILPKFSSNLFTMSIVVIYNRDGSLSMNQSAIGPPAETANERILAVRQWYGGGYGGGDVQLVAFDRSNSAHPNPNLPAVVNTEADLLEIRPGSWVMLSPNASFFPFNASGNSNMPAVFRWYRVLAADDTPIQAGNYWTLDVTLEGADWRDERLLRDINNPGPNPPNSSNLNDPVNFGTQVTVVKDVVAVYEKTVRLQTRSLWTTH